jgi:hypothetical protein
MQNRMMRGLSPCLTPSRTVPPYFLFPKHACQVKGTGRSPGFDLRKVKSIGVWAGARLLEGAGGMLTLRVPPATPVLRDAEPDDAGPVTLLDHLHGDHFGAIWGLHLSDLVGVVLGYFACPRFVADWPRPWAMLVRAGAECKLIHAT